MVSKCLRRDAHGRGAARDPFGLRQFRRSPGLAAGVALTIGLGVGANLAIVALLSDIFFPAHALPRVSRLVMVENTGPYFFGGGLPEGLSDPQLSMPDFEDVARRPEKPVCRRRLQRRSHHGYDRRRTAASGLPIFVTPGLFDALGPSRQRDAARRARTSRPARRPLPL